MNRVSLLKSLSIVLATTVSFSTQAEMYKWVDEDGVTQYTQTPPPGDVEVKTIKPPPRVDTESAQQSLHNREEKLDNIREDRLEGKQEALEQAKTKEEIKRECYLARKRLASYQRPRVNEVLPDGTRRLMPEEERQFELQKSRDLVQKACYPD